jgi:microcystin-dependent protein
MHLKKRAVGAVGRIEECAAAIPPRNTIKANGAELSRVLFWRLFKHAQEGGNLVDQAVKDRGQYGTGDGVSTFTIPDRRGVVGRGFDDGAGLDSAPTLGRYQPDNNKSHSHSTNSAGNHSHGSGIYTSYNSDNGNYLYAQKIANNSGQKSTSSAGSHSHSITSSGGTEAAMKNVSVLYCIRYQ